MQGIAPTITASDSLSGRTLTIAVDSTTGNPAPTTALTALTLDGVDVLGDVTGTGPWAYEAPDSASAQTVAWTVTATNGETPDGTADGSTSVPADLFAPTAANNIADLTLTQDESFALDVYADFSGTEPITYALAPSSDALPAGLSLSTENGVLFGTPTSTTSALNIIVRGTNSVGFADTAFGLTVEAAGDTAPTAANNLPDFTLNLDQAMTPVDVSADFSGTEPITYALAPSSDALPAGLSLSTAGILDGTPTDLASALNIIVRGTNSVDFADTAFGLTIEDPATQVITADTFPTLSGATNGVTIESLLSAGALLEGNYNTSSDGDINNVILTVTIDGQTESPITGRRYDEKNYVFDSQSFSVDIRVEDNRSNDRLFSLGSQTLAGTAPVATDLPVLPDFVIRSQTMTIQLGQYSDGDFAVAGVLTIDGSQVNIPVFETPVATHDYVIPFKTEIGAIVQWEEESAYGTVQTAQVEVVTADPDIVPEFSLFWNGEEFVTSNAIFVLEEV